MEAARRVDYRLPGDSKPSREDELGPKVDQQDSIDDRLDVSRSTLSENGLVDRGTLPAVGEIDGSPWTRPVEVKGQIDDPNRFARRQVGKLIRDRCSAASANVDLAPVEDGGDGEAVASRVEPRRRRRQQRLRIGLTP